MSRLIAIAGSHTDVGKTFVACRLVERLIADGHTVDVRKPVLSGFDVAQAEQSDAGLLLRAAGRAVTAAALDAVTPWRFPAAIAPDAAARAAGVRLSLEEIVAFSRRPSPANVVVVETAGGVMSPLTDDSTALDLLAALAAPTILVVGAYLGGISHGLTAHLALRSRGVEVAAVVVSRATYAAAEPFRRFLPNARVLALTEGADRDDETVAALVRA